jgi:hypothetical protein
MFMPSFSGDMSLSSFVFSGAIIATIASALLNRSMRGAGKVESVSSSAFSMIALPIRSSLKSTVMCAPTLATSPAIAATSGIAIPGARTTTNSPRFTLQE